MPSFFRRSLFPIRCPGPLIVGAATLLVGPAAWADDGHPHLQVVRTAEATACPDAPGLAASVARAVGYEALEVAPEVLPGTRFDVVFARVETGYLATIRRDGLRPAARTLAGVSCTELTDAVVVAVVLMLDDGDTPAKLVAPPPPIFADPPPPPSRAELPPSSEPPPLGPRHWYGWETLVLDAASTTMVVIGTAMSNSNAEAGLVFVGATSYVFSPMFLHIAHGRWRIGLADFGLRLGAVVTLGTIGALIGSTQEPGPSSVSCATGFCNSPQPAVDPGLLGLGIGAAIGVATASIIDATLFARDKPAPIKEDGSYGALTWSPTFSPVAHGATAGVVARF